MLKLTKKVINVGGTSLGIIIDIPFVEMYDLKKGDYIEIGIVRKIDKKKIKKEEDRKHD